MSTTINPERSIEPKELSKLDRKFLRFWSRTKKVFSSSKPKSNLNENQELAIIAMKKLLVNPETVLLFTPETHIRCMLLEDEVAKKEVYATLENKVLRIVNGRYSYDVWLDESSATEMKNLFDLKINQRYIRMEEKIAQKRSRSLREICDELTFNNDNP